MSLESQHFACHFAHAARFGGLVSHMERWKVDVAMENGVEKRVGIGWDVGKKVCSC